MMTTKEIYELDPSKWVVYYKYKDKQAWYKLPWRPSFSNKNRYYKNIAKKHEAIADAVIANPDVEVEWYNFRNESWHKELDFFADYKPDYKYQLKPQKQEIKQICDNPDVNSLTNKPQCDGKFNGGFIEASQEAYDLLYKLGVVNWKHSSIKTGTKHYYVSCADKSIMDLDCVHISLKEAAKQFYINNKALSWDEPKGEKVKPNKNELKKAEKLIGKECYFSDSKLTTTTGIQGILKSLKIIEDEIYYINEDNEDWSYCEEIQEATSTKETNAVDNSNSNDSSVSDSELGNLSIVDRDGNIYEFEKPEFSCKLFGVANLIAGVIDLYNGETRVCNWTLSGEIYNLGNHDDRNYNLTPIKPKWYNGASITKPIYCFIVDTDWTPSETPILCQGFSVVGETAMNLLYNYNCDGETFDEVAIECVRPATKEEHQSLFYEGKQDD